MNTRRPRTLADFIALRRQQLNELATDAMLRPKKEPFDHGVQAGKYQGGLDELDALELFLKPSSED